MRIGLALMIGIFAVAAPLQPLHSEPSAETGMNFQGVKVDEIVRRSLNGANLSAAFSYVGILVAPEDIVVETGGTVRSSKDEGFNGETILQLGKVSGTDTFERKIPFKIGNPDAAIIDHDGQLLRGLSIDTLVRQNIATRDEVLTADLDLFGGRYGIEVSNGIASAALANSPTESANAENSIVTIEEGYHGETIVTIMGDNGDYRRLLLIKDFRKP